MSEQQTLCGHVSRSLLAVALVVCGSVALSADQARTGVGSRNTAAGPAGGGRRIASSGPLIGARLADDGALATVRLLDNANQCLDGSTDCVVYLVEPDEADPDLAYAGDAMVRSPVLMSVIMVDENAVTHTTCALAGISRVNWQDVVERGPTIAGLGPEVLQMLSNQASDAGNSRYRLLWCPLSDSRAADSNPWGQSWRLRLIRKSVAPRRTP